MQTRSNKRRKKAAACTLPIVLTRAICGFLNGSDLAPLLTVDKQWSQSVVDSLWLQPRDWMLQQFSFSSWSGLVSCCQCWDLVPVRAKVGDKKDAADRCVTFRFLDPNDEYRTNNGAKDKWNMFADLDDPNNDDMPFEFGEWSYDRGRWITRPTKFTVPLPQDSVSKDKEIDLAIPQPLRHIRVHRRHVRLTYDWEHCGRSDGDTNMDDFYSTARLSVKLSALLGSNGARPLPTAP
jgi:hypothetical protein